jgi:ferric-dicitrate binding protein FerR (iron transport regulator)
MGDDALNDPGPGHAAPTDAAELAVWERFLSLESGAADDAQIDAWSKAPGDASDSAAVVRTAVLHALTPIGEVPTVDAHAMLARLRARLATNDSAVRTFRPARFAAHARRLAAAAAWAAAAGITIAALAQPRDVATRSIQLGRGDTGTYLAGPEERLRVRMPDGTDVIAGPNSSVRVSGPRDRRSVTVKGEAFVDANRDTVHRLVVRAGNAFLQNVGARFAVRTDSDNKEVRIAVATGIVLAGDTGAPWQSGRVLTRGTVGVVSTLGITRTFRPADLDDAMVWEHGGPRLGRDQLRDELPRLDGA